MSVDPTRSQFDEFKKLPRDDGPIFMLNLIRYRSVANYPEGHECFNKGLTGQQAYALYLESFSEVFKKLGGRQVWAGIPQLVLTGPQDERWDMMFIAEYPNAIAFMRMVTDPEYKKHVVHRTAAVQDSRLIRMKKQAKL